MTSVSNAGRKRGRGKGAGKKRAKNLNRGQVIGVGKYLINLIVKLRYGYGCQASIIFIFNEAP